MRLPPKSTLSAILFLLCCSLLPAQISLGSLISLQTTATLQDDTSFVAARLLLQPEASLEYDVTDELELAAELSLQGRLDSDFETDPEARLELYRLWGRVNYAGFELRAGLQQLNFGVARVLRPLQWFDQIDPQDKFQLTSGVQALLLRKYFPNNVGIWAWGILAEDGIGTDEIDAVSDDPEYGARLELPGKVVDTGLSFHFRDFKKRLFLTEFRELRLGLDLRYDGPIGAWLEACASSYKQAGIDLPSSGSALSLGADYTLGIGNGLYLMQEIYWRDYVEHLNNYRTSSFKLASMASYPLGILDNLQFLHLYDDYHKQRQFSLSWQRNYDYLSWELRLNLNQHEYNPTAYGIMARLSYNI